MMSFRVHRSLPIIFGTIPLLVSPSLHAQSPENPVPYETASPLVRVAIMRFETAKEIWVRADPGGYLSSSDGAFCDNGSNVWKIRCQGENGLSVRDERGKPFAVGREEILCLAGSNAETVVGVRLPQGNWAYYRGALEIGVAEGHLRVISRVPLEAYLRGVVSSEMGIAPPEALKAQAVAARTYALYSLGKWAKAGYDLRDTPDSQVYRGIAGERTDTDAAIAATAGQILLWNGKPAATLFCADCGGTTTPPTTPETFPPTTPDEDAHGTADKPSPPAWTLRYPPEQLAAILNKSDRARGSGTLDSVETIETDVSGRVRRLRLTWKEEGERERGGEGEKKSNPVPYSLFPVPYPLLTREITGNMLRSLLGLEKLKSTLFTVKRETSGEFVIMGRGYGHGRGMCQTGAMALAGKGFDYRALLNRYYAGGVPAQIIYSEGDVAPTKFPTAVSVLPCPKATP